jgi:hypothetical protein
MTFVGSNRARLFHRAFYRRLRRHAWQDVTSRASDCDRSGDHQGFRQCYLKSAASARPTQADLDERDEYQEYPQHGAEFHERVEKESLATVDGERLRRGAAEFTWYEWLRRR